MSDSLQLLDCSPPGFSVTWILCASILELPSHGDLPDPGSQPGLTSEQNSFCLLSIRKPNYGESIGIPNRALNIVFKEVVYVLFFCRNAFISIAYVRNVGCFKAFHLRYFLNWKLILVLLDFSETHDFRDVCVLAVSTFIFLPIYLLTAFFFLSS